MAVRTWHPYAPDQAFGCQAAQDEELVDQILARLDLQDRSVPRAGNKATPQPARGFRWQPTGRQLDWIATARTDLLVTTATALDAAPFLRNSPT
jgi:hypothetical protein